MSELELLREHLRLSRTAGFRFPEAWPVAVEAVLPIVPPGERKNWTVALITTKTAWERAYEKRGRRLTFAE